MGKDRAYDQNLIVFVKFFVHADRHIHAEPSFGHGVDFFLGDHTNFLERFRAIPLMIEERNGCIGAFSLFKADFQTLTDGFLAHGLMRAEGNHDVHGCSTFAMQFEKGLKHPAHWGGSGAVGDDQQDFLALKSSRREAFSQKGLNRIKP